MDQQLIPLVPNLKFVSELKEDQKTKYYELHEKAKETLEGFFCTTLQNLYLQLHKLLTESIESHITIETLRQIIYKYESSQDRILPLNNPSSEILGASPNCSLRSLGRTPNINEKKECNNSSEKIKNEQIIEKENISKYVDIFSNDFLSDAEDESFVNHKSPIQSVDLTPVKVQSSPVFNKRKRSRKSHSLVSNNSSHSITSSNDSKVSLTNTVNNVSTFEKNIVEIDTESDKEIEKELTKEPLKSIDNTYSSFTPTRQTQNKDCKLLSVSKTNYGKTDFSEKGKRLRQTTLTLKKATPVIDISKEIDETNSSINDTKSNVDFLWNKSLSSKKKINKEKKSSKEYDSIKKPLKALGDSKNYSLKTNSKDGNTSTKDDDLIETSPAYSEKSKLRNKLTLPKKPESQIKVKTQNVINDSETYLDLKNVSKENTSKSSSRGSINSTTTSHKLQSNALPCNTHVSDEKRTLEPQRTLSDDTYFSLAELTSHRNDLTDCDMTEFEVEEKQETPPAKRMLLSSFDIIPGRKEKSPDFAYKEGPVRKKSERAQLPGWDCRECQQWYGNLPEEERKKRQNQCSRHRGKYKADILTPESFWNPVFDDSHDSSADDY